MDCHDGLHYFKFKKYHESYIAPENMNDANYMVRCKHCNRSFASIKDKR